MLTRSVHVAIIGRVQGVGFRAWVEDAARAGGLTGWVRNRRDGSVEAVLCGDAEKVTELLAACETGPRAATVFHVDVEPYSGLRPTRFTVLPTE